jgi:hypothetical protein
MQFSAEPRRRAISQSVARSRLERSVAAPLAARLAEWHQRSAALAGAANHALLRGSPVDQLRMQVEDLLQQVIEELDAWRSEVPAGMAGGVWDAEKSCRSLVATLDDLHTRLR